MITRRSLLRAGTLALVGMVSWPALGKEPAAPIMNRVKIEGKIFLPDGTPASDVTLTAVLLESGKLFRSEPTRSGGGFEIVGATYGYYLFAIEAKGVLHASARPLNVPPRRRHEVNFVLREPGPQHEAVTVPGLESPATASADVLEPKTPFLKRPSGIVTLVGASLLALLLLG